VRDELRSAELEQTNVWEKGSELENKNHARNEKLVLAQEELNSRANEIVPKGSKYKSEF
jgi:hypothetical protein